MIIPRAKPKVVEAPTQAESFIYGKVHPKLQTMADSRWNLFEDGVTCSMLSTWLSCPEKARLSYGKGLRKLRDDSEAMDFGTMVHDCCDATYSKVMSFTHEVERIAFINNLDDHIYDICQHYWDVHFERLQTGGGEDWGNLDVVHALSNMILPHYFRFYVKDFTEVKWVSLERVFDEILMVRGRPIRIRGKIDGEFDLQGLWLKEIKSKGRINEGAISDKLAIDLQVNIYLWAMWKKYGTYPVGVQYDVIRKPGEHRKKDEKTLVYAERCEERVVKEPDYYFKRIEAFVMPNDIRTFEEEFIRIMECVVDWFEGGFHYKNVTSCSTLNGVCDFLKLCGTGEMSWYKADKVLMSELKMIGTKDIR